MDCPGRAEEWQSKRRCVSNEQPSRHVEEADSGGANCEEMKKPLEHVITSRDALAPDTRQEYPADRQRCFYGSAQSFVCFSL